MKIAFIMALSCIEFYFSKKLFIKNHCSIYLSTFFSFYLIKVPFSCFELQIAISSVLMVILILQPQKPQLSTFVNVLNCGFWGFTVLTDKN